MTGRGRGGARMPLGERADRLRSALDVGGDELDPAAAVRARDVLRRVDERWAISSGRTVVALAGATGSGKSSLFNALVGREVSAISPRRPTTTIATAAVWGSEDAGELLDWLGVDERHQVPTTGDNIGLDGLVLLDLPDIDSRELAHRVEADRVLERADVFVWVVDPQKYADARLHDDYLRTLRHHDTVMIVVLNQADRVREQGGVERITDDLRRLIREDGAGEHEIIPTSARLGTGLASLQRRIGEVVGARNATEARLVADLRGSAEEVGKGVGESTPRLSEATDGTLHEALRVASGVPVVLDAVQRDYRRQAHARAGWAVTRWLSTLRPDPLRRLRLGDDTPGPSGIVPSDVRGVLGRSSLPSPTPAARANVQLATRELAETAGQGLPAPWAVALGEAASPQEDNLADALDQAVMGVPLRRRNPAWWGVMGALQLLLVAAAVVGLLWLAAVSVLSWLQVPVSVLVWGPLPVPLVLVLGGLLCGVLLALLAGVLGRVGARRRRAQAGKGLDAAIAEVAQRHVHRPVLAILDRHEKVRESLVSASG